MTSRAVAQKSSIPALEGLLLRTDHQLTVSGYNMQTGIRTNVPADVTESGEIVLNARLFGDIIRRMPDDVVTVAADDKLMVHLSCGDSDFDILGLSAADYPDLPEVEDEYSVSIQQKTLRAMIEEVAFAVSTNESRPVHTGALFEIAEGGLTMVAVDGFRLAVRREKLESAEGGAFSFVAPGSALNEVKGICGDVEDLASVTLGKRHILFEVGETELICRRLEGEFLDYKNAIPRKNPITIIADTKALIESIDRVSVVISDKLKSPVRCTFDHDRVLLTPQDVRLMRRMVRDRSTRNTTPEQTMAMWDEVCEGESEYINPYRDSADFKLDTTLDYEPNIFHSYLLPFLENRSGIAPEHYRKLDELYQRLDEFFDINNTQAIPADSVVREFIGPRRESEQTE